MVNPIYTAAIVIALFFSQAAHTLPQAAPTPTPLCATFNVTYDNKDGSLNSITCSNSDNGLAAKFPMFSAIPSFPFISGAFDIGFNSPNCSECWNITNPANGISIPMTAINSAGAGFNMAQEVFTRLNGGSIGQGSIDVIATKLAPFCGL